MERLAPRPAICPLWAFPAATHKEPEPNPPKRSLRLRPYKRVREGSMEEVEETGISFVTRLSASLRPSSVADALWRVERPMGPGFRRGSGEG